MSHISSKTTWSTPRMVTAVCVILKASLLRTEQSVKSIFMIMWYIRLTLYGHGDKKLENLENRLNIMVFHAT